MRPLQIFGRQIKVGGLTENLVQALSPRWRSAAIALWFARRALSSTDPPSRVFPCFSLALPRSLAVHDIKKYHSIFLKFLRLLPRVINLSRVLTPCILAVLCRRGGDTFSKQKQPLLGKASRSRRCHFLPRPALLSGQNSTQYALVDCTPNSIVL